MKDSTNLISLAGNQNPAAFDFLTKLLALTNELHRYAMAPDRDTEKLVANCIALNTVFSHPYYTRHFLALTPVVLQAIDRTCYEFEMILAVATIEGGYALRQQIHKAIEPAKPEPK